MRVFLDDWRNPIDCVGYMHSRIGSDNKLYLDEWFVVRSMTELTHVLNGFDDKITHISFDYDLYEYKDYDDNNGADCLMVTIKHFAFKELELPKIYIHSQNMNGQVLLDLILKNKETFQN